MEADKAQARDSSDGDRAAEISREMVRIMRKTAGRGPTKARTTIGRDHVLVMFHETLTEGERVLVDNGHFDRVAAVREGYQLVLRDEAVALIERVLDRRVLGFMSNNHFEPDIAAELFVLEPGQPGPEQAPLEAEHQESR